MYPSNYRGRPVTETNIQDYISNIVSKYLPPDLPPWQICVIPMSNSTRLDDASSQTLSAPECGPSSVASTSAATVEATVEEPAHQTEIDSSALLSVSVLLRVCVNGMYSRHDNPLLFSIRAKEKIVYISRAAAYLAHYTRHKYLEIQTKRRK